MNLISEARAGAVQLLAPLPNTNLVPGLKDYLAAAFPLFIKLAALLTVLIVAYGGLEYIFSNIPGAKAEGKQRIWAAIGGLLLVLAAWLILYTINPSILSTDLSNIGNSGGTPTP